MEEKSMKNNNDTYIFNVEGINIVLEKRGFARITNDENLDKYVIKPGHQSRILATKIKKRFKEEFNKDLNISVDSLTVEILGHIYPGKILSLLESGAILGNKVLGDSVVSSISNLKKIIDSHVNIIDCGIASLDNNRKVWDTLAPFRMLFEAMLVD